jgi:cellulose synthase operon protein C
MKPIKRCLWALPLLLIACQSMHDRGTIGQLRNVKIEIREEKIDGGLEKAMQGYQHFLQETPDSALTPEAIRRLADLKIEQEYGTLTEGSAPVRSGAAAKARRTSPAAALSAPEPAAPRVSPIAPAGAATTQPPSRGESEADFEKRATRSQPLPAASAPAAPIEGVDDLERANAREAIALYEELLAKYPLYDRNDQVLYQMSRAYEELGQTEAAMAVMERMVRQFPQSRYIDEVQFRRAEYFFTRHRYLDAEEAYTSIVRIGVGSTYYELALYKLGWTYYKQELYDEALDRFIALLDHKVSVGYDFAQTEDEQEHKRAQDTFRVISLSFSNLGGAESVVAYFREHGQRSYEDSVYSNLAEFYFDKRRFADASATYNAFVKRNPFHKKAPNFHMRVIEIHAAGGFPSLVLDAKKAFATNYGLKADYWKYFDPADRPDVLANLKTNLTDLANHYHACYQKKGKAEEKPANFAEALHWYGEFLSSFPQADESPAINYQMADLLFENQMFGRAAVAYEKTAYDYPTHEKSAQAGYAAVFAYRQHLAGTAAEDKEKVRQEVVRCSLKFADTFPKHEKAALVLGAAADDLYGMQEYERALTAAGKLLQNFPDSETGVIRSAWLVTGHSSYELEKYSQAETAYLKVLALLPAEDKSRAGLVDNLAASIYKQGEQAKAAQDYQAAADHFLRVGRMAPTSKIRATAEYDGAAALIQLKNWSRAAEVLVAFRKGFPGHELQPEVTKKLAYVYKENHQLSAAAEEYERIESESKDDEIRREALQIAAELHAKDGNRKRALVVYRRYVEYFPQPVVPNLETRDKIAEILKAEADPAAYLGELRRIVAIDAAAGPARTPRTRELAAKAALVLAEQQYNAFAAVRLVKPFKANLAKKRDLMKAATRAFDKLLDYEIGDATAAATYYLAEIYADFSKALTTSERPEGLNPQEKEQYELAIEEQAYPFEEKAISVHESNLKLIGRGVYNAWIDKSLQKLAVLMPARYDKPEAAAGLVAALDNYTFAVDRPAPGVPPPSVQQANRVLPGVPEPDAAPDKVAEPLPVVQPEQADRTLPAQKQAQADAAGSAGDGAHTNTPPKAEEQ